MTADHQMVTAAIEKLRRCVIPGEPGRIDAEIAELGGPAVDVRHAARILGITSAHGTRVASVQPM